MMQATGEQGGLDLSAHHRELTGYCYRMLGSPFEADDAVQETMLRAWRSAARFEGRAAVRTWLFRIATNVCLDMLNARRRRALPMEVGPPSPGDQLPGVARAEDLWIGPINEAHVLPVHADPADVAIARDSIRLAFVAALQHLTPKQRAALILRDVFRWKAKEVAGLLETSPVSVESQVRRARAVLATVDPGTAAAGAGAPSDELVDRYVDAFQRDDVDALVRLLHDDVTLSMPPNPLWLRGVEEFRTWFSSRHDGCRDVTHLPTRVNGSTGFGLYRRTGVAGVLEGFGVQVVEQAEGRIIGIHAFLDARLLALFDLPASIDGETHLPVATVFGSRRGRTSHGTDDIPSRSRPRGADHEHPDDGQPAARFGEPGRALGVVPADARTRSAR